MTVFFSFFSLLFLRVPIFIVLGATSIIYIFSTGNNGLFDSVPQRLFSGVDNFSLLAIPLFMLAGELMNYGGITSRLINFAKAIVGHYKGGLAYVNVVANTFLASILGSSLAQTAMMSRVMVPAMEKEGYQREFSTATTAAAAMLGPIIPPSMIFIIYSIHAETSIGRMFIAGIMPGILLALSFILFIIYYGHRHNLPKSDKQSLKQIRASFYQVIPALSVPVIIIVGILSGIFTATESAAIACLIAILAGALFYRELKLKELPKILINTATTTATVTLLIVTAKLFGLVLTFERIPQLITEWMVTLTDSPLVFLLIVNLFLLLVGMFLDGIASLILLSPILIPVAMAFNIDPIHLGVVMCLNIVIGSLTPPVGAGLFVASSIAEVKLETLVKAIWPFLAVSLVVLALITYFPQLILWLPNMVSL
ncbi:C4-dicarboxylate ABC transporter permease [Bacillus canaveralius]|uniref:C4-dicarboxylate ABC transporter permease n=1 Tax=Bacillus canaveralius TaxID=1403243 RepID=A0A2N5GMZ8_9BACI|nr:TRAP transporter large permease [Bacillus canaveralius]PLR83456.1 C4-dicarboxylate ABC transporter permease [Bacillus canaveralius]PLR95363.1 C4-dicarboxylate ABC transporter permease [Bacillus canaveralius]